MQNEELQRLTVLQLRKLARDNGVKLSAGIDKDGIVARIAEELDEAAISRALGAEDAPKPAKRGRPRNGDANGARADDDGAEERAQNARDAAADGAEAVGGADGDVAPLLTTGGESAPASIESATRTLPRMLSGKLSDMRGPLGGEDAPPPAPKPSLSSDLADEVLRDLEKLQESPVSADVTSVEPGAFRPVYRQAWQARPTAPREPGQKPAWSQPARGTVNRFGPPAPPKREPEPEPPKPAYSEPQPRPIPENAPKLDGYRLGYRAAPQRAPYQNRDSYGYQQNYRPGGYQQQGGYQPRGYQQPGYRQSGYGYPQQGGYQQGGYRGYQPAPPDQTAADSVYRMQRDPQFAEQAEAGQVPDMLQTVESVPAGGILEILPDGYGFLRGPSLLPGRSDTYVSMAQVRRYGLRTGDKVEGAARAQRMTEKYAALMTVDRVNGHEPEENPTRPSFEQLVPVYPNRRIVLENEDRASEEANMVIRLVDLIAPIGFGQRAMIVCPPDCARLSLLEHISSAIKRNDADAEVLMLLIDVAPEEVTEIREGADAEVFATTFADAPETQTRVSETMLERAMRLVEEGRNVVILLDSLTKLTRAYQAALVQGGRPISNTVTPAALVRPKRFFGAARNTRDAGSLTVVATIAVETGSRVDDIVFEEFKGTANMELFLCASQRGDPINPMIDLQQSGTKKDDMLLNEEQKEGLRAIRQVLKSATNGEAVVQLIDMMKKTRCNADLLNRLKDWIALWEKSGYLRR